ncbi:alpha-amylase family glycosyl hydrolase [Lysobacter xanthus]
MLVLAGCATAAPARTPPDWRDQVVYFLMIDRFDNGDPRNDDQGAGEFDPRDGARYSGGDLAGVTRRLDYIRGLGATAVWITPPVAHQWWNPRANYGGYHGYWAEDFSKVDAHFGTLADYRALADGLHARGMQLVQDIVVNHVADHFRYEADPGRDPANGYMPVPDPLGRAAPTQAPFDLNDPRRARDRAAGIYHWTPDIADYADPVQEKTWQLAGLDDLDTENPVVRRALRASYGGWIRDVGVDAFRVDTAYYVPRDFFDDFLNSPDAAVPGVLRVARAAGKPTFHLFGEGFGLDRAFDDTQARKIESYVRDPDGHALLPGMINFPLYGTALDVFARGRPTAELADRIERMMRVHAAPQLMPTFVDNHDVDRFRAAGSAAALRQALLMLMTLPGIPTIYYGTEQGLAGPRDAMFAGGYGSGGRDRFDPRSAGYRDLQRMIALRRGHRVLSRGVPTLLASNAAGPGAVAWRMDHAGEAVLVAFNTADHPVLLDALDAKIGALAPLFALDGVAPAWKPGRPLVLPARAGYVWRIASKVLPAQASPTLRIDPLRPARDDRLAIGGRGRPGAALRLVVDGDLGAAATATADAAGRWRATLRTDDFVDPEVPHRLVAFDAHANEASAPVVFRAERAWREAGVVEDPAGDDTGPDGRYRYPADPGWTMNRPGDLRRVRASTSGGALQLDIGLARLTRSWNPANGFDHVALTVYIEVPGAAGGIATMPLQDATLPGGMRWHRRLRIGGWSNLLTSTDGADARHEGAPVTPGARLAVDEATATLRLRLPARALGAPASLHGARLHVTTWDYDGGYRPITPAGGTNAFGGAAADAPKVLDAATLVLD